jgi:hypothetical protein
VGLASRGAEQQAARGGNRSIGRRLWRILQAAGFEQVQMQGVMVHSDALGMEAFVPLLAPDPVAAASVVATFAIWLQGVRFIGRTHPVSERVTQVASTVLSLLRPFRRRPGSRDGPGA